MYICNGFTFETRFKMRNTTVQTDKNRYNIPILAKGMALLEEISRNPQGLTLTELTSILNAPKTSLYRILCSLVELGYLRRDDRTARFSMTHKIFGMAISSIGSPSLLEYAYDPMRRLRDMLLETVVVGTLTESQVVILDQIIGLHHFCFTVKPGMNVCLHASAPGKAIAAYMEPDELRMLLGKIDYTRYNENTISCEDEFLAALGEVRHAGYALDRGEEIAGVRCIGAHIQPLLEGRGGCVDNGARRTYRRRCHSRVWRGHNAVRRRNIGQTRIHE